MHVVSLASPASLPSARVLARSLGEQHPDWSHETVLLADARAAGAAGPGERLRPVAEVLDVDLERVVLRHEHADLVALLLPRLLGHLAEPGGEPVLHLPATAWVLGSLQPAAAALAARSVLLVPRAVSDVPDDGLAPTPQQLAAAGRICESAMGIDGSEESAGFLSWWTEQLECALGSVDGARAAGRPEDRPWLWRLLELAPARFATAVLDGAGCNLSLWNLHLHRLERADGGGVSVDGDEDLRFMDLPGFDPRHPHRLNPIASRVRVSRSPVLRELCVAYAEQLLAAGWEAVDRRADIGRRLGEGLVYDEALLDLHACATALGEDPGDVFSEQGASAFAAWLGEPAPEGGAHGINRYVYRRLARERPDVLRAYPDLDGDDGRECVSWCRAFGRTELGLAEQLLPPPPGRAHGAARGEAAEPARGEGAEPARGEAAAGAARGQDTPGQTAGGEAARGELTRSDTVADLDGGANGSRDADAREQAVLAGEVPAVRLTGYMSHALGLGAAARGYAQALAAVGVPTSTVSVPLHHLPLPVTLDSAYGRHSFEDLVHEGGHGVEVVAVNPDELPALVQRLGEGYFQGPRIGIWGWETDSIPARWAPAFELVDEIWVYSRFMAENIGAAAPVPVIALPPPVQVPPGQPEPIRLGIAADSFMFLFVFDYLSTVQRKNPIGLIEAFKRAFAPGEGPQLMIKTINGPLRPLSEEQVLWAAHGRGDVHVVDRSLTTAERDGLMAACDCYVSLHRSEGFGLTMAEAMALAKPVIATAYSGNLDFMDDRNSYLVEYELGLVGPECEIYPADGRWAEPSVEHAAVLMREVYEQRERAAEVGARARADIEQRLSPQTTGAAMRRRLLQLAGTGAAMQSAPGAGR